MRAYLVFPLISAIMYVVGALLIKRASELGAGLVRTTLVSNCITALVFSSLGVLGGQAHWDRLWQPGIIALLYIVGQLLTYLSFHRGDVSVATPVLSIKLVLVAFLTTLILGRTVEGPLWVAAGLTTVGIALLHGGDGAGATGSPKHRRLLLTVGASGGAALCFAAFDVLVLKWAGDWGLGRFLPIMMGMSAILTILATPALTAVLGPAPAQAGPGAQPQPQHDTEQAAQPTPPKEVSEGLDPADPANDSLTGVAGLDGSAPDIEISAHGLALNTNPPSFWPWLIGGSVLMGTQSVVFVATLALTGQATAANVTYATRGLWSVVAVRLIGHWFSSQEQKQSAAVMRWRMAGAACVMAGLTVVAVR